MRPGLLATVNPCESGAAPLARAGVSPSLVRANAADTHWNLRVPILLGYFDYSGTGGGCDDNPGTEAYGYLFSTGLEAIHWSVAHRVGFNMRLLVGTGGGKARDTGPHASSSAWSKADMFELAFSVGLSFH
jgi:hypothetical protein